MTTLHDRLQHLADDATDRLDLSTVWERGRREHRIRRVGAQLIVVVAVIALAAVLGTWRSQDAPRPAPASPDAMMALPDEIFEPSGWLPGTDDDGPLGRLAATVLAERGGWTGSTPGVVGISATTQDYRFLDLPSYGGGVAALSPDGRKVAWWTVGEPAGTPNTGLFSGAITGYAVYDSVTGDVVERAVETQHGLAPDDLDWAGDDLVVAGYGQIVGGDDASLMDQSSSVEHRLESWQPGSEAVVLARSDAYFVSSAGDGSVLVSRGNGYALLDAATGRTTARPAIPRRTMGPVVLSSGGREVAVQTGNRSPTSVSTGTVGQVAQLRVIPGTRESFEVVGWADTDVVVAIYRVPDHPTLGIELVRTSLDGTRTGVIRLADSLGPNAVDVAADLLSAPFVAAEEPPTPLDPRVVAGLVVAVIVAALVTLVAWRRRRVPLA